MPSNSNTSISSAALSLGLSCLSRPAQVRDKDVRVKITDLAREERATYVNVSVGVDDNNSAKVIYKCNPGSK